MTDTPDNANGRLIAGIGAALVDILINEDDAFLEAIDAARGGMTLVDAQFSSDLLKKTTNDRVMVPGGSTCNTIVGIGQLGGACRFVGKCGNDDMGKFFESDLVQSGVDARLLRSPDTPTGRVISIVTPDAQRTMFTYLGASAELGVDEVTPESFAGAAIVHIEGYLLFNRDLIFAAGEAAKAAGAKVCLDLASYTVVEASHPHLNEFIDRYVDILLANEDEARAFTGVTGEVEQLKLLADRANIAAVKVGKRGSFIAVDGNVTEVAAIGAGDAIDTTGAGDLWAAGFLYGLVNNLPIETCGTLASACGFEVVQVMGASIPPEGWTRIKKILEQA